MITKDSPKNVKYAVAHELERLSKTIDECPTLKYDASHYRWTMDLMNNDLIGSMYKFWQCMRQINPNVGCSLLKFLPYSEDTCYVYVSSKGDSSDTVIYMIDDDYYPNQPTKHAVRKSSKDPNMKQYPVPQVGTRFENTPTWYSPEEDISDFALKQQEEAEYEYEGIKFNLPNYKFVLENKKGSK